MRRLASHLTYANVVASLALFIALGGVSYAAIKLPANSVGSAQLKNNSVTLPKISPGARAALRGSVGAQGQMGPAGPAGPAGQAGDDGSDGADGADGVAGAAGATGATGATGVKGDPGTSEGYIDHDSITIVASQSATTVATTNLDAGKYLIAARLKISGQYNAPVSCALANAQSQQIDSASIRIQPSYLNSGNLLMLSASTTLASAGTVTLSCTFPDPNNANNGNEYTIETSLSAVQVSTLHDVD